MLGLAQPSVSHALRRLREQFDDPLFQRVGNRMEPTDAATRLHEPLEAALALVEQAIHGVQRFAPEASARHFRLAMTDSGELFAMPRLLSALGKAAPHAGLSSLRISPGEMASALRSGLVDLAIGYLPQLANERCEGQLLLEDRMICLMRAGHPAEQMAWNAETFARLSFVDVGQAATGYQMARTLIEESRLGFAARARLEHLTIVPDVVLQTDYVAVFPRSIFTQLKGRAELVARELPFDLPSYEIRLWSHERFAADPAVRWLKDLIVSVLAPPTAL